MRTRRIGTVVGLLAAVVALALPLGLGTPPAPSAPAQDGCVACHTSKALLEPLVPPLPPPPADGEG
jgi:mono/diheme cytochrome c family protein